MYISQSRQHGTDWSDPRHRHRYPNAIVQIKTLKVSNIFSGRINREWRDIKPTSRPISCLGSDVTGRRSLCVEYLGLILMVWAIVGYLGLCPRGVTHDWFNIKGAKRQKSFYNALLSFIKFQNNLQHFKICLWLRKKVKKALIVTYKACEDAVAVVKVPKKYIIWV